MKTVYLVFRERLAMGRYSISKIISAHSTRKEANDVAKDKNKKSKDGRVFYTVGGVPFVATGEQQ